MLTPEFSLKLKTFILSLIRRLIFFSNGHIDNVLSKLHNVVKIDVKNDKVVLTLSNVVQINIEIDNVDSTLVWRWVKSRRHINLKNNVETTLKYLLVWWKWITSIGDVGVGFLLKHSVSHSKFVSARTEARGGQLNVDRCRQVERGSQKSLKMCGHPLWMAPMHETKARN